MLLSSRITPAHAGKTLLDGLRSILTKDHPRACGENSYGVEVENGEQGSPPRMRGKLSGVSFGLVVAGITPAHAGKTYLFYF